MDQFLDRETLERANFCIHEIRTKLLPCVNRHAELERELSAHRALIAPINYIPNEILQEIFLFTVPDQVNISVKQSPLILGRVCSRWRKVSQGMPELWSSINGDLEALGHIEGTSWWNWSPVREYPSSMNKASLHRARDDFWHGAGGKEWLERSGTLPLTLSLRQRLITTTRAHNYPDQSFSLLEEYSSRWKTIVFCMRYDTLMSLDKYLVKRGVTFPMLESFSVTLMGRSAESDQYIPFSFLQHSPQLRSFSLHGLHSDGIGQYVPWSQLTHLDMDLASYHSSVLPSISNIVECSLYIRSGNWIIPKQPTVLPSLRKLCIQGSHRTIADIIPRMIMAPNLQELEYGGDLEILWDFVGDPLRRLTVYCSHRVEEIVGCVLRTPFLESLTISQCDNIDGFDRFIAELCTLALLPNLNELHFEGCPESIHPLMLELVRVRAGDDASIEFRHWLDEERVTESKTPISVSEDLVFSKGRLAALSSYVVKWT
ncbi:hypothetical protein C8J56DRAFT_1063205 [Mycena floridula]|nr:hypothetical protein C8J56DRAFT_1063205 [Mycena floridula]